MEKKEFIRQLVIDQGLLPLYYNSDAQVSLGIMRSLYRAGIRAIEYTNRGENALDNFMDMRKLADAELPGMQLGIGTVKTVGDAEMFIAAGADFIICPIVNSAVAERVHREKLLWIPGCMTPTEIQLAESNGASLVKLFPGNLLGPAFISSIKELFPNLLFMPTGGVEVDEVNLRGWFSAGAVAVGIGSRLVTKSLLEKHNFDDLEAAVANAMDLVNRCRK